MENIDLVRKVVEEVLQKLKNKEKRVLALFCGGTIGAAEGISELKKLIAKGYKVGVTFTPAGSKVIGVDKIKSECGEIEVISNDISCPTAKILENQDVIVVPVLTQNSAAKIANGIADNMVTTLIMHSLLLGKRVIAARNACDLNDAKRIKLGMDRANDEYKKRFEDYLIQIQKYGIKLVDVEQLADSVEAEFAEPEKDDNFQDDIKKEEVAETSKDKLVFTGKILTASDVSNWTAPILKVMKGTLVTPLARDVAHQQGIEIKYC